MTHVILVCDNEEPLRALIRATLEDADYEIVEARDGHESLELARSAHPDLIVLDMMMPGRTGMEVLAELRADDAFAGTPVIMLTARTQSSDRAAAAAMGADRFIAKPFSPLQFAGVVAELLSPSE